MYYIERDGVERTVYEIEDLQVRCYHHSLDEYGGYTTDSVLSDADGVRFADENGMLMDSKAVDLLDIEFDIYAPMWGWEVVEKKEEELI